MNDSLRVVIEKIVAAQAGSRMSDAVILAIIGAFVTIATLITNAIIQARAKKAEAIAAEAAKKAETLAAAEAAKVTQKLDSVEIKIDGRLTQLLETAKSLHEVIGEKKGYELGKAEEQTKQVVDKANQVIDKDIKIAANQVGISTEKIVIEKKEDPKTKK